MAGFRQARVLWEENPEAIAGEQEARLAYAEAALAHGDLGLAAAQAASCNLVSRPSLRMTEPTGSS